MRDRSLYFKAYDVYIYMYYILLRSIVYEYSWGGKLLHYAAYTIYTDDEFRALYPTIVYVAPFE